MSKKNSNIGWSITFISLCTILGIAGIYLPFLYILFPLIGIPLILGIYKIENHWTWLVSIGIAFLIGLLGNSISSVLLILLIILPTALSGWQIRQEESLPRVIIITGLAYFVGFFLFFFYMKWGQGVDIPSLYYSAVQKWEIWFLKVIEEQQALLASNTRLALDQDLLLQSYGIMRMATKEAAYQFQILFPSLFFIICIITSAIVVLISTLVIQAMGWKEINFTTLTKMKVSPGIPILLICTWLLGSIPTIANQWILDTAISNLIFVFSILFFYLGVLLVIYIMSNSKMKMVFKILLGIMSVMWLFLSPSFFVFLGFFDGLFNMRKDKLES
ncbi:MAG: DUF2232 domain-containing protein [Epulopiscium sp.]|nr:DUF2232 domain-containing protein [Candidatus Epulonipiscium sp.]